MRPHKLLLKKNHLSLHEEAKLLIEMHPVEHLAESAKHSTIFNVGCKLEHTMFFTTASCLSEGQGKT